MRKTTCSTAPRSEPAGAAAAARATVVAPARPSAPPSAPVRTWRRERRASAQRALPPSATKRQPTMLTLATRRFADAGADERRDGGRDPGVGGPGVGRRPARGLGGG